MYNLVKLLGVCEVGLFGLVRVGDVVVDEGLRVGGGRL